MRELKFDLVCKNNYTGAIHHKKYFLSELMIGVEKLFDIDNYEILAKRQYIGLKNRNGKEIYEGDILTDGTHNAAVLWWQANLEYGLNHEDFLPTGDDLEPAPYSEIETGMGWVALETIGNIYEHGDLLK